MIQFLLHRCIRRATHKRSADKRVLTSGSSSCRGNVTLLMAVALVLATVVGVGVARTAATAARRSAAQAAADATALAGAERGRPSAEEVAASNGAELMSFTQDHIDVEVTISRRGHTARARARWHPRNYTPD